MDRELNIIKKILDILESRYPTTCESKQEYFWADFGPMNHSFSCWFPRRVPGLIFNNLSFQTRYIDRDIYYSRVCNAMAIMQKKYPGPQIPVVITYFERSGTFEFWVNGGLFDFDFIPAVFLKKQPFFRLLDDLIKLGTLNIY